MHTKPLAIAVAQIAVMFAAPLALTLAGPDDGVTVPYEDSPEFDCRVDGNAICGPDNAQGAMPGQYQGGKLVPWPHEYRPEWCRDICLGA